jgi:tetratricopeptide (TPR) repeat protein
MRQYRAAKANEKGAKAHNRGEFTKARRYYDEALRHVPGYNHALTNLGLLRGQERYFNYAWGREALDRGELDKARAHFLHAQEVAETAEIAADFNYWLDQVDKMKRYKPAGSLMMLGTGAQIGWNVKPDSPEAVRKQKAEEAINDQLALAGRQAPEGVDLGIFNMGLGIAATTSEFSDLFMRVLEDQWTYQPVPRSGTSGYNAIKGKRFDLLGCHSNGAMTCLLALHNDDIMARDVVLYGPQITEVTALLWQRLLRDGKIRSLRIVVNTGDPVPPLAMAVNTNSWEYFSRPSLLFNSGGLKSTLANWVPSAQIDARGCEFRISSPFACHYMKAYPQCRSAVLPKRIVPGPKGFLNHNYTEPPPPQC